MEHIVELPNPNAVETQSTNNAATPGERQLVALYKAAVKGNWKLAEKIMEENPSITHASIMRGSYTALQIAAGAQHVNFVKKLMDNSTKDDLRKKNENNNNAFCVVASAGSVEIAEAMLLKDPTLLTVRGNEDNLPLWFAAWFGHEEMVKYLYQVGRQGDDEGYSEEDLSLVFFTCIESGLFGAALTFLESHHTFAQKRDSDGKTALHLLAQKPSAFIVGTSAGNSARKLLEALLRILEGNNSITTREFRELIRNPPHVLFDAVRSGNSELVVKLIDVCPSLIWETNDKNWSIIHAAVSNRDATIFNLVHEIGFFKDVIVDFRDNENGDTILHLAARLAPTSQLDKIPGAAFQMQRELLWFEEVKNTVQAAVTEVRNGLQQISQEGSAAQVGRTPQPGGDSHHEGTSADQQRSTSQQGNATESRQDKTPQELFTIEHKLLLKEGRKWMNGTAQSCTVVSTLIAGALFAAGITVTLGGNKGTSDNNLQKMVYRIFIISDAMAFLFALAAILTFLVILTSRYAERDFLKSLPFKLIMGLGLLFSSIITMMVAFGTAFIIAYGVKDFLPFLVIGCAVLVVLLYLYMQLPF